MKPALVVAALWMLFGATHIGFTTARIRAWMVSRLGELGFTLAYSALALTTFALVIVYYSRHQYEGVGGLALGALPFLRPILIALIVASIGLMLGTFANYPRSPYAIMGHGKFRSPHGLQRITRHPFFCGLSIFAIAHTLLATHLVGTALAAGFAVVSMVGMMHQDRKLEVRYGAPFAHYLECTSIVPFAAIIAGRQAMNWRELPAVHLVAAIIIAVALRAIHSSIFAHDGWPFLGVLTASLLLILLQALAHQNGRQRETAVQQWRHGVPHYF